MVSSSSTAVLVSDALVWPDLLGVTISGVSRTFVESSASC